MLISRIEHSMNMMLEGIDSYDISLILEASQEFQTGLNQVKNTLGSFSSIIDKQTSPDFNLIKSGLTELKKELDKVDTSKVPKEFSFASAVSMRGESSNESDPVATLTKATAVFDSYYSGTKDAIIAIAEGLEPLKEIFSVGSKGIFLTKAFVPKDASEAIEKSLSLKMLAEMQTGEQIANVLATGETSGDPDAWRDAFQEQIDKLASGGAAENEGIDEEKRKQAETTFLDGLTKAKDVIIGISKAAANKLIQVQPNTELASAVKETGFLQTLFKKSNPYEIDKKMAESIVSGMMGLPILELNALIKDLIDLTNESTTAIQTAIEGAKKESDKTSEPPPEVVEFQKKLWKFFGNDNALTKATSLKIAAILEKHGMKKAGDLSGVKLEDIEEEISKFFAKNPKKQNEFFQYLEIQSASTAEVDNDNAVPILFDTVYQNMKTDAEVSGEPITVIDAITKTVEAWVDQLTDRQKEVFNTAPESQKETYFEDLMTVLKEVPDPTADNLGAAADQWGVKHKISDSEGTLGNPNKFSPLETKKIIEMIPLWVNQINEESVNAGGELIKFIDKEQRIKDLKRYLHDETKDNWGNEEIEFVYEILAAEELILIEGLSNSKIEFIKEMRNKLITHPSFSRKSKKNQRKLKERFNKEGTMEAIWKYFKEKGVKLQESRIFNRWGVIAGIIKG